MSNEAAGASAATILAEIAAGRRSAVDAVRAQLALLREVDARTNAVADFNDERALADAGALDRLFADGRLGGPLHGLPLTVKDCLDVEGFRCSGGSDELRERRPQADATVVGRLRAAGAVVVAKTRVWGGGAPGGRVLHPLDGERTPGGSSSGEAVAVAAGGSLAGLGSDSGGSIRLPAAWCGVFGFKPSVGRVPNTGHFPRVGALSDGRTQIGPLARTIDDLELLLCVISGPDGRDAGVAPVPLLASREVDLRGARFATLTAEAEWRTSDELVEAAERAAGALEAAGMRRTAWPIPWLVPALDITQRYWGRSRLTGAEAQAQLWDWDRFRRAYLEASADVDFLVTPVAPSVAPAYRETGGADFVFTLPASLTGSPAISVPMGAGGAGLPLSVQIIGRPWEDHRVLAAARKIAPGRS